MNRERLTAMQALCDFYNLHMGKHLPNDDERERISNFLNRYAPNVTRYRTAKDIERAKGGDVLEQMGTLGWYEHTYKISWFDSEDCRQFLEHWQGLRRLVDGIVDRKVDLWQVTWFQDEALTWLEMNTCHSDEEPPKRKPGGKEGYRLNVGLLTPSGNAADVFDEAKAGRVVSLDDRDRWHFTLSHRFPTERFGLSIGIAIYQIHRGAIDALEKPDEIRLARCEAGATPWHSPCQNVFRSVKKQGPFQKFCSARCRRRTHEAKQRQKSNAKTQNQA